MKLSNCGGISANHQSVGSSVSSKNEVPSERVDGKLVVGEKIFSDLLRQFWFEV